jgi:hypothetical protein
MVCHSTATVVHGTAMHGSTSMVQKTQYRIFLLLVDIYNVTIFIGFYKSLLGYHLNN